MDIEEFGYKQALKRSLSLTDLVVYGMIFMIPIAPFGVYGYVNAEAPGMVPLAYIIGMVAMFFLNKPDASTALPDPSND